MADVVDYKLEKIREYVIQLYQLELNDQPSIQKWRFHKNKQISLHRGLCLDNIIVIHCKYNNFELRDDYDVTVLKKTCNPMILIILGQSDALHFRR